MKILDSDSEVTRKNDLGKSTVFKRGISNNHQFDHFLLERVTD